MNKDAEEDDVDEVEKAVLLYNISLVHYQTRNYEKAVVILEKLFKLIEPLEEGLAYKICFLLVECYLSTYQTEGAAVVVYYLDKQMTAKSADVSFILFGNSPLALEVIERIGPILY